MKVFVNVALKEGILDPQGKAVHHALEVMNFEGIKKVRIGKQVVLDLDETDEAKALEAATAMAKKLLVNEVTEDFTVEIAQ